MREQSDFTPVLEFFQIHQECAPGDIGYDSAFCECMLKASSATEASIWKLDQEGRLHLGYGTNIAYDEISNVFLKPGEGIGGAVALSRDSISISDAWQEPQHDRRVDEQIKFRTHSMISAPILFGDILYGVLNILNYKHGGAFPVQWKDLASVAGAMYGAALAASGKLVQNKTLSGRLKNSPDSDYETVIVGVSRSIQDALSLCLKAAKYNLIVIIRGETGTGKELIARRIHEASERSGGPFIGVNCAALTETLLESELFGHVKGAFSGADRDRKGKFLAASKGTLFLDEIGEMSQACQAKILRVLQEKRVTPVGSEKSMKSEPRIICATNHNLWEDIKKGKFREDLFFRLYGIEIIMPPLRERPDDIPLLAKHFLRKLNHGRKEKLRSIIPSVISDQAMEMLVNYKWPGNVRQLEQAIQAAYAICEGGKIKPDDFPDWLKESGNMEPIHTIAANRDEKDQIDSEKERSRFLKALEATKYTGTGRWNLTAAARELGIPRKTFTYRLKRLELKP